MSRQLLIQALLLPVPWRLRRRLLIWLFGFEIAPSAKIGWSLVAPTTLVMKADATIGHLNLVRGMDLVQMEQGAGISHLNWITGIAQGSPFFSTQPDRRSEIIFERGSGITRRHFVDCSNSVRLGEYSMVAGYNVQILTHSVDIESNVQATHPVTIGAHALVGTGCIVLGGSRLPDYSALGAGSVLRNRYDETHRIYSGVPAKPVAELSADLAYFSGSKGQPGHRRPA